MQAHRGGGPVHGSRRARVAHTVAGGRACSSSPAPQQRGLGRGAGSSGPRSDWPRVPRWAPARSAGPPMPRHRCKRTRHGFESPCGHRSRAPLTHQPFKARCTGSRAVVLEARLTRVIGPCARVCCAVYGISVGPNRISLLLLPWIAACVSCRHPLSSVIALRWQAPISHDGRSLDEVAGPAFTQVRANTDQVSAWQSLAEMVGPGPQTAGRQTVWK